MTITRVDHIAIAVESLDAAVATYRDALGIPLADTIEVPEQGVRVAFLPVGESQIELLEPLGPETGVAKHLARRGPGLHHICLEVDDIVATLAALKAAGVALVDETPRQGAHGRIAFIHPRGAHGVLIELVQHG